VTDVRPLVGVGPAPAATRAAEPQADLAPRRAGWRPGWRRTLVLAAPALVYLGVRQLGVLILMLMAAQHDETARRALTSWDGEWFLGIAEGGYRDAPQWLTDANGNRTSETPLAFFPGYPKTVGWLSELTGMTYVAAGFVLTLACGVIAAYGVFRIGTLIRGGSRRVGLILVALFAASPMAVVLSMTYSEAMFCAFAAWTLVFLLGRQWLAAGVLCAVAGLVRITAFALVLAIVVAAVVFLARSRGASRAERAAAVGACLLAPVGVLSYLWWAGSRVRPDDGFFAQLGGWSELQRTGWGSWFDGGASTVEFTAKAIGHAEGAYDVGTVAVLLAAVVLAVLCWVKRLEWPLLAYSIGVLAMDIGSNGLMNSKARLLVPAFTLLIPVAVGLARRRPATAVLVLAAAAVVSGWFGSHALIVWEYAI